MKSIKLVIIATIIGLSISCTEITATEEECKNEITLAQAVVDRDLGLGEYLKCKDGYKE